MGVVRRPGDAMAVGLVAALVQIGCGARPQPVPASARAVEQDRQMPTDYDWWRDSGSACPKGATFKGSAPPYGYEVWCEKTDGTKHGRHLHWYANGNKWEMSTYHDGKMNGPWISWHEGGSRAAQGWWADNLLDGQWIWWHENGVKAAQGQWRDGRQFGLWAWWHSNGKKKKEGEFRRGSAWVYVSSGTWRYWDERGDLVRLEDYLDGKLVGLTEYKDGKAIELIRNALRDDPMPTPSTKVAGDAQLMRIEVNGRPIALPVASLRIELDPAHLFALREETPNLHQAPESGYPNPQPTFRPQVAVDGRPAKDIGQWQLVIQRTQSKGGGSPARTFTGTGPVDSIVWDGLGEDGKPLPFGGVYIVQFSATMASGAKVTSEQRGFGVGYGVVQPEPWEEVLRGTLFSGRSMAPKPKRLLERTVAKLAKKVRPRDTIIVENHADGAGDRLQSILVTQRQARAVRDIFAKHGIDRERVTARGRGSLEPLEASSSRSARKRNRRLIVRVVPAQIVDPDTVVPVPPAREPAAVIDGKSVELDGEGRFVQYVKTPANGALEIHLEAGDGRKCDVSVSGTAAVKSSSPRAAAAR
jgi:hypothetical protein